MTLFKYSEIAALCNGEWQGSIPDGHLSRISSDSRNLKNDDCFLALAGENFDGHDYIASAVEAGAAVVISHKNMPCPVPLLRVGNTLRAYQQLATAWRQRMASCKTVGITGSSGKTSTKEIVNGLLSQHYKNIVSTAGNTNNQIGVPQNLFRINADTEAAVLEMGTNFPGEISLLSEIVQPDIALLTNIGPVHLEGLGDLYGVAREKAGIFSGLQKGGLAVISEAVAAYEEVRKKLPKQVKVVGESADADVQIDYQSSHLEGSAFRVRRSDGRWLAVNWALSGRHMALNAGMAVAIADHLHLSDEQIVDGLQGIELPKMRMAVSRLNDYTIVNDAYNANPDSMKALIDWLADLDYPQDEIMFIPGDMLELGDDYLALHREILDYAAEKIPAAQLFPFGSIMQAATADETAYNNFSELAAAVQKQQGSRPLLVLKASRGTGLEKLLPLLA